MSLTLPVLYGSVRSERQGITLARHVTEALRARGHDAPLIDPIEFRLPLLDKMYKEYKGDAPPVLAELAGIYARADGFVIVSGEYNHGVPPALKNLLDHFLEEYFWRPSAIVSYSAGSFGGVRAAMQLRMTLGELGMPSIPSTFPVPAIGKAFGEDGKPADEKFERRFDKFARELEWYAEALKAKRAEGVPY
ncbi:NADPH-dependent FMN reductase [Chenggangzhangella methanolivorans]|uniref:NAD(P)H-dependent oxidoreductase n=1 Tax=Chenggangzhangella methanolivorans TaxID=1437009 RepID=A0A9E6RBN5_9HYPH|nr:NADPH-dependent FMN reductase [Chenggangzhangella methanolivorans]QZO01390.1 NAD(P)H-dependent oxidoreductase [Chenggangzhangella methanolivorans]